MDHSEIDPSLLEQFQAVTNADFAMAQFLLEASGGDFDLALNTFFGENHPRSDSDDASCLICMAPSLTLSLTSSEQQQVSAAPPHQNPSPPASRNEDRSATVLRALQGAVVPPRPLAPLHTPAGPSTSSFATGRPPNPANRGGRGGLGGGRGGLFRVLGRVVGLPWVLLKVTLSSLWVTTTLGLSLIEIIGSRILPPRALRAARGQSCLNPNNSCTPP